ncbi:MAG: T9SS type A sorting domain-containing protein [Saprospirales bacterium]|nr:T9SS type A sorting domain-containing protein [Saprospirales bacterium]
MNQFNLEILDDLGRNLINTNKEINAGKNTIETDMRSLANGIYLLKVISEKSNLIYTKKIVKQ